MRKKKYIYSEEQLAQKKIYHAKWRLENKEAQKIYQAKWKKENPNHTKKWRKENPEKEKEIQARFYENNPNYITPCRIENPDYNKEYNRKYNLGYWIVYIITDYNGLGDDYCGQTQNIHTRMANHKSQGRLNTDTYTIVKKCDTLEDALEIESAVHNFGYHGDVRTELGK